MCNLNTTTLYNVVTKFWVEDEVGGHKYVIQDNACEAAKVREIGRKRYESRRFWGSNMAVC